MIAVIVVATSMIHIMVVLLIDFLLGPLGICGFVFKK